MIPTVITAAALLVLVLAVVVVRLARKRRFTIPDLHRQSERETGRRDLSPRAGSPDEVSPDDFASQLIAPAPDRGAGGARASGVSSAAELLACVQELASASAQWPEILARLNPRTNAEGQQFLEELRRAHVFAPHLALRVLEEGCQRTLGAFPGADAVAALRAAAQSTNPFVRD